MTEVLLCELLAHAGDARSWLARLSAPTLKAASGFSSAIDEELTDWWTSDVLVSLIHDVE